MVISDWILLGLFLFAIIIGWRLGTIGVLGNIGSCVIGYLTARICSPKLTDAILEVLPAAEFESAEFDKAEIFLSLFVSDTDGIIATLITIALFVVIFIVVRRLVLWISDLISDFFGRGLLGQINNAGGSVLSLLLLFIVVLLCADIFFPVLTQLNLTAAPETFLNESEVIMPLIRYIQYLV